MTTRKHLFRLAMTLLIVSLAVTSCQKSNNVSPVEAGNSRATVSPVNTSTVTGIYGNPANPNSYGTVKLQLAGTDTAYFTSQDNSYITAPSGYTVKYLYTTTITSTASIGTSDYTAATTTTSGVGYNTGGTTPNGWYNYIPPGGITIINYVYTFIHNNSSGVTYVLKVVGASAQQSGSLDRGVFTVEHGVVN